ncbi:Smr/MutS family protein [Erythrobacter sp. HKB08]|uniref:Smr/MutS family protein n=1 Tax=Erythrobacter sp. HKB08 TaxID=2502843 RepID=UPI00100876B4|nr:Smr/MutS family protein [Erythrobacter sp. HKB08]
MSAPRGLTEEEAAAWERLAASVTPLESRRPVRAKPVREPSHPVPQPSKPVMPQREPHFRELLDRGIGANRGHARKPDPVPLPDRRPEPLPKHGLDSHWDRKLKSGQAEPDFSLDLHGHSLDAAYNRLESGLFQAKAMGARLVLVVTGKPRPVDAADRGSRRGAIRAKILDWLAAGPHGADIAAIRKAHRRHGGEGALYLVLKRNR